MGKGIDMMEPDGVAHKATWHGKSPKPEQSLPALEKLKPNEQELKLVESFREHITWRPEKPEFRKLHVKLDVDMGEPTLYEAGTVTDCRSAYGNALVDLARRNRQIVALTADLRDSVKTDGVAKEFPDRHIEVGIAEQHMVSCSGGMSLDGLIPFCSTFGGSSSCKRYQRYERKNGCHALWTFGW
jgi:transketolase